jgi:phosphoribosyl 1,2-cyclic phosphodiesterase
MKFSSLGSGSDGNALLIASREGAVNTHVMLDCGFGLHEAERRLALLGVDPSQLTGIVVTHEHSDHIGGVFKLARRHRLPVWLSHGTWAGARHDDALGVDIHICSDGQSFLVGGLQLTPYTVPHDAREPVQYVATDGQRKLGVLTDIGQSTPHVLAALAGCDALLLEFNHDSEMLAQSVYPAWLKARISGPHGHLSNDRAAALLSSVDKSRLRTLVAAHLSQKNNTPGLVRQAIAAVIGEGDVNLEVADQDQGFDWRAC